MLIKVSSPYSIDFHEITPESTYLNRRQFLSNALKAGMVGTLGLSTVTKELALAEGVETESLRAFANLKYSTDEKPTEFKHATQYNNFYEFGTDKRDPARYAHKMKIRPWSLLLEGECHQPGRVDIEDLLRSSSLEERIYRLRCVEAWSMVIPWIGIPLSRLLDRCRPTGNARFIELQTLYNPEQMPGQRRTTLNWPYREGLRIDEAYNPLTLLTIGMYGRVLPNQNGAPIRLVVPWKYGFKSIKSIVGIRFVSKQPNTTWNLAQPSEYGFYANVNPIVNHPRWSQKKERRIGELTRRPTLPFNGYATEVASLYKNLDLTKHF